ncbi:MAG: tetratricopeptide repeat protein [Chlamydiales bacterium]
MAVHSLATGTASSQVFGNSTTRANKSSQEMKADAVFKKSQAAQEEVVAPLIQMPKKITADELTFLCDFGCYFFREKEEQLACSLFERAALHGHKESQWYAGAIHASGAKGVTKDVLKAYSYWVRAGAQGHSTAQYNLGALFFNGEEIGQDFARARFWLKLADLNRLPKAESTLKAIFNKGLEVEPKMGPLPSLVEAAAASGYKATKIELDENSIEEDPAAQQEKNSFSPSRDDLFNCGLAFYRQKNQKIAFALLEKAAALGHREAQFYAGIICLMGENVEQNGMRGFELMEQAAAQGHPEAQYNLGMIYFNGFPPANIAQDYVQALLWLILAGLNGVPEAKCPLGKIFFKGLGVEQDINQARALFVEAAASGFQEALAELEQLNKEFPPNLDEHTSPQQDASIATPAQPRPKNKKETYLLKNM